ncbi:hypothetical protein [Aurantiacibacter zhengii]|uniref:Uncharacterized protein n=1 Tax=Aurantiacibacter zhengii TaxID=2307003 RepID=A0A418NUG4_9SPHN|nr:hypothetical protein [Aurantiacibacter zhengii]RIV87683.1 hypothetical protein D2V07_04905 [Aurantiacibacter zhengii]
MRTLLTLSAAALLLSSCGGADEATVETADGESVDYSVDSDNGDTQIRISGDNGEEMVINSGSGAASDLPAGYSLYPGASVVQTTSMNQGDGQGALVIMESDASPAEMVRFYRQQAEAAGVQIQMEMNANGTMMIGGESESGGTFSFNASPSSSGTTGQLVVGQSLN